ncbi:fatty-acid peroxygenase [Angustibacter speluncae]
MRVGGLRHVLLRGREGARAFYDTDLMVRTGAVPRRISGVLFGEGAVHGLDGEAHRHRKAMFLDVLSPSRVAALEDAVRREWRRHLAEGGPVDGALFEVASDVLCRNVCAWAGVPDERAPPDLAGTLRDMVEGATGIGPRHVRGRLARRRGDRWAAALVGAVRSGAVVPRDGSALAAVSTHRDHAGLLLPERTAGVELLNVLRPAVAVDRLVVFAAMALHEHPVWRTRVRDDARDGDDDLERFVLEVRRRAPFVPALAARPVRDAVVDGVRLAAGRRVLLDVFGTDHDPRAWPDPFRFDPDRFRDRPVDPHELVPQGGGDHATGHRCPGEWATTALLRGSVRALAQDLRYDVPPQDLRVSPRRVLGLPRSRFLVSGLSVAG